MTNTLITSPVEIERSRLRRYLPVITAAVLVATTAFTAWGAHHMREFAVVMLLVVATMIGIYGVLLPRKLRTESAGGTALVLSLIGVAVLLPAFWSGLPLILGVAGTLLGYAGRNATSGARLSIAAFVVGLLSSIGYITIYVIDFLGQSTIG